MTFLWCSAKEIAHVFESFVAPGKSLGSIKLPLVSPALDLVADSEFLLKLFLLLAESSLLRDT